MRRDKAEARAGELQRTAEPDMMYYAFHRGRNSWIVNRRIVRGERYEAAEYVEG